VFENRVLRKIFVPKRDEVTGEWRELHTEELHNLYSFLTIIRYIKSRRIRWAGHVTRMGEERRAYMVLVESPKESDNLEDRGVDGRMGLELILGRLAGGAEWIKVAQDSDRRRDLVTAVILSDSLASPLSRSDVSISSSLSHVYSP
jgi:hypothetical protein